MRILLADDHALFRDGVASLLEAWGHDVVGQASDGEAAVALATRLRPDLVLMDVAMPGGGGMAATRRIAAAEPGVAIVMLTASEDVDDLFAAIKAGARGYLLKNLESAELRGMLEAVGRGEAAITPAIAARILAELSRPDGAASAAHAAALRPAGPDRLTDRELGVLRQVVAGLRNKEIAAELGISENTVKFHLRNILDKLHAQSRTEVVARAVREGLVPGDGAARRRAIDNEEEDPLDAFLEQFTLADAGQLLAAAAEFRPGDPAHAAAWADVHKAAKAEGMEAEIDRLRRRVAQWATQGSGVTSGHLGTGQADELLHVARAAAAGSIVDAGVVEMLGAFLDPETIRVLVRPWGLPERADDQAPEADESPGKDA